MGVFDAVVAVLLTAVAMALGRGGKNDWIILVGGALAAFIWFNLAKVSDTADTSDVDNDPDDIK